MKDYVRLFMEGLITSHYTDRIADRLEQVELVSKNIPGVDPDRLVSELSKNLVDKANNVMPKVANVVDKNFVIGFGRMAVKTDQGIKPIKVSIPPDKKGKGEYSTVGDEFVAIQQNGKLVTIKLYDRSKFKTPEEFESRVAKDAQNHARRERIDTGPFEFVRPSPGADNKSTAVLIVDLSTPDSDPVISMNHAIGVQAGASAASRTKEQVVTEGGKVTEIIVDDQGNETLKEYTIRFYDKDKYDKEKRLIITLTGTPKGKVLGPLVISPLTIEVKMGKLMTVTPAMVTSRGVNLVGDLVAPEDLAGKDPATARFLGKVVEIKRYPKDRGEQPAFLIDTTKVYLDDMRK